MSETCFIEIMRYEITDNEFVNYIRVYESKIDTDYEFCRRISFVKRKKWNMKSTVDFITHNTITVKENTFQMIEHFKKNNSDVLTL